MAQEHFVKTSSCCLAPQTLSIKANYMLFGGFGFVWGVEMGFEGREVRAG
jgi:hypothetical protein